MKNGRTTETLKVRERTIKKEEKRERRNERKALYIILITGK